MNVSYYVLMNKMLRQSFAYQAIGMKKSSSWRLYCHWLWRLSNKEYSKSPVAIKQSAPSGPDATWSSIPRYCMQHFWIWNDYLGHGSDFDLNKKHLVLSPSMRASYGVYTVSPLKGIPVVKRHRALSWLPVSVTQSVGTIIRLTRQICGRLSLLHKPRNSA